MMDNLFWLLWLSDVLGTIGCLCLIVLFVSGFVYTISTVFLFVDEESEAAMKCLKRGAVVFFVTAVVCVLTPTKTTIHALIAVNAGKAAVNTQLGEKAMKALDTVLDRVIAGEKKDK